MNSNLLPIVAAVIMVVVVMINMVIILSRYKKVGPNQLLIVSGRRHQLADGTVTGFRVVRGGGTFVMPVIERADVLSLEVLAIEMPGTRARVAAGTGVEVDCTAQVKINSDDASIMPATECFLGKTTSDIKSIVRPVLEKHLALVLAASSIDSAINNPAAVATAIQTSAAGDLSKMGMSVVSVNVRNVRSI